MTLPVNGNVNVHFTIEGEKAFYCACAVIPTWLQNVAAEYDVEIRSWRQEFFDKNNPQSRLGSMSKDKVVSSEAKQFDTKGKLFPVFKGGKDVIKT